MSITVDELVGAATVIPVLTVTRLENAVSLARALKAGGLQVIEITWRTAAALEHVHVIRTDGRHFHRQLREAPRYTEVWLGLHGFQYDIHYDLHPQQHPELRAGHPARSEAQAEE